MNDITDYLIENIKDEEGYQDIEIDVGGGLYITGGVEIEIYTKIEKETRTNPESLISQTYNIEYEDIELTDDDGKTYSIKWDEEQILEHFNKF